MTAFVAAVCGIYGLIIGSFLNVVIYRVPRKESIVKPPSHCPGCDKPIAARDNIPVVSWLLLRGKCRNCREPISIRYPAVELLTGVLFVAVGIRFSHSWALPAYLLLTAALVALSVIDLDTKTLPNRIIYPVGYASIPLLLAASGLERDWDAFPRALGGAAAAFAFFYIVYRVGPRGGMGFGDVRLSFILGLYLGWLGWGYVPGGLFMGFVYGAVVGIAIIIALGPKKGRKKQIPFGPYLAAGTMTFVLCGAQILDWYRGLSGR